MCDHVPAVLSALIEKHAAAWGYGHIVHNSVICNVRPAISDEAYCRYFHELCDLRLDLIDAFVQQRGL